MQVSPPPPVRVGVVTFLAFVAAGCVPIVPLPFSSAIGPVNTFTFSAVATLITFAVIGAIRGRVTEHSRLRGSVETVAIGGTAAALAFLVGYLLRSFTGV
jgi:VIT1/CCC1 family predicted Fe2+/Mn2+ transporter